MHLHKRIHAAASTLPYLLKSNHINHKRYTN